jgi:Holliday junction resolvasome RuvABC endonuclease subunit
MRIIAIDPTLSNIGVAVFEDDKLISVKCIQPEKDAKKSLKEHTKSLNKQLRQIIKIHTCETIVMEYTDGKHRSYTGGKSVLISAGLIMGFAGALNLPYVLVSQQQVKEAMTGRKTEVEKDEVLNAALRMYPCADFPRKKNGEILQGQAEHIADAIGVYEAYKCLRNYTGGNVDLII